MTLELIPFDPVKAAKGAQVVTRDFRKVQFEVYNPRLKEPVRCRAVVDNTLNPMTFFENGQRVLEKKTKYDLFLVAPLPLEREPAAAVQEPVDEAKSDVRIVAFVVDMPNEKGGRTTRKLTPEQFGDVAGPEEITQAISAAKKRAMKKHEH